MKHSHSLLKSRWFMADTTCRVPTLITRWLGLLRGQLWHGLCTNVLPNLVANNIGQWLHHSAADITTTRLEAFFMGQGNRTDHRGQQENSNQLERQHVLTEQQIT